MRYPQVSFVRQNNIFFIRVFMILFLSCIAFRNNLCLSSIPSTLKSLPLDGHFTFDEVHFAAKDFGNRYQFLPAAILHPKSVSDIANTIKHIWQMGPHSELTVAARGHGHSLQGQSQAHRGVVISMESLQGPEMQVYTGNSPYVDVSGGELWINILHESLLVNLSSTICTILGQKITGNSNSSKGNENQQRPPILTSSEVITPKLRKHTVSCIKNIANFLIDVGSLVTIAKPGEQKVQF